MYNFPQENPSQVIFRSLLVKEFQGGGERLQIANQVTRIFSFDLLAPTSFPGLFPYLECGAGNRLQNSRFRKAGSAVSVILECDGGQPYFLASLTILPRCF